jgi:hypothetical protein
MTPTRRFLPRDDRRAGVNFPLTTAESSLPATSEVSP